MKKLLLLVSSLLLVASTFAQVQVSDVTAATTIKRAVTRPATMFSFQVTDTSGTNNLIYIRDNNSATITNQILPAYSYYASWPTNIVQVYTNMNEVVVTNTLAVQHVQTVAVAQSTNAARLVNSIYIPANGTVTWIPNTSQGTSFGIQLYSLGTTAYTLTYLPLP